VIGLVAFFLGYWLGTQSGRHGLNELVAAFEEVRSSPEARGMAAAAASTVSAVVGRAVSSRGSGVASEVTAAVADRLRERFGEHPSLRAV